MNADLTKSIRALARAYKLIAAEHKRAAGLYGQDAVQYQIHTALAQDAGQRARSFANLAGGGRRPSSPPDIKPRRRGGR